MLSEKVGGPDMAPHTPPTLVSAPGNPGRYSMTGQCVVAGAPHIPPGNPGRYSMTGQCVVAGAPHIARGTRGAIR